MENVGWVSNVGEKASSNVTRGKLTHANIHFEKMERGVSGQSKPAAKGRN
jgi:hypothetical protein